MEKNLTFRFPQLLSCGKEFFAKNCLKVFSFTNVELTLVLGIFYNKRGTFGQQECKLWTTFHTNRNWFPIRDLGVYGKVDKWQPGEVLEVSVTPNLFACLPCSQTYPTGLGWLPLKHTTLYLGGKRDGERRKKQYPPGGAFKRHKRVHINKSWVIRNNSRLYRKNGGRYSLGPAGG